MTKTAKEVALSGTKQNTRPKEVISYDQVITLPPPPDYLDDYARELWSEYGTQLIKAGVLQVVDLGLLASYCCDLSLYRTCMLRVKEDGINQVTPNGYEQQRPEMNIANKAIKSAKEAGSRLGFSSYDRQRIKIAPAKPDEEDPLSKLMVK